MLRNASSPERESFLAERSTAAFADKKVNYNNNPILKWCLTNTAVKKSGLNNIQPVKINERRRIDGAVSLLNAWVLYVKYYEDFMYSVG